MRVLLCAVLALILAAPSSAASRKLGGAQATAQNDGNKRVGLSASCTSAAWTLVSAARTARRGIKLKASDSNSAVLCLGTADDGATCTTTAIGYELGTGDAYEDSSEAAVYCRAASSGAQVVKGFELYDTAD